MQGALRDSGVTIYGGERAAHALGLPAAPAAKHEYGEKALTLELVPDMEAAVEHIHRFGSGHTEAICTGERLSATNLSSERPSVELRLTMVVCRVQRTRRWVRSSCGAWTVRAFT